jgi:hypothetical protein
MRKSRLQYAGTLSGVDTAYTWSMEVLLKL